MNHKNDGYYIHNIVRVQRSGYLVTGLYRVVDNVEGYHGEEGGSGTLNIEKASRYRGVFQRLLPFIRDTVVR